MTRMNRKSWGEPKPAADNSNDMFDCFVDNTTINEKSTIAVPSTNIWMKESAAETYVIYHIHFLMKNCRLILRTSFHCK